MESYTGKDGQSFPLPQQNNMIDCGVYVCWWACNWFFGTPMEPKGTMDDVRAWMVAAFLFYLEDADGIEEGKRISYQGHVKLR